MVIISDIFHIVLRVMGFYVVSIDEKLIDSETLKFRFSIENAFFYSVMNNDERNGCVLTQRKVFFLV